MSNKEIFHVHTKRCGHAEDLPEEEYVKKAIELGADRITFTDHAPFPGDYFNGRMKLAELPEYIATLLSLKRKYADQIDIVTGLEIEYLPSFHSYIEDLKNNEDIQYLLLGQHFYELSCGSWSFNLSDKSLEWKGLLYAQMEGIASGLFDGVAHPDRAYKRCKVWTEDMQDAGEELIAFAGHYGCLPLEKNFASRSRKKYYWSEFWDMVPKDLTIIYGCDAHSVKDLIICDKEHFEIS